jgi:hypothetical protein
VNEGAPVTFTFGPVSDPSSTDTTAGFHYAYDCNGGALDTATYAGSGAINTVTCVYPNGPATATFRARVIDKDGGFTEVTQPVTVNNVAPTLTFSASNPTNPGAGSTQTYAFTVSDPGNDAINAIVQTSCGTLGTVVSGSLTYDGPSKSGSFKCAWGSTTGGSTVAAAATDADGATGAQGTQPVTVKSTTPAPVVTISSPSNNQSFMHGTSNVILGASYTVGGGGPYTCTINWGDPGTTPVITTKTGLTGTTCSATHQYANAGMGVVITVTVTDKNGATSAPATRTINIL